ncbi:MAG: NAD-dependent epimerase/dehydratase family protein, partial [Hungatella sp.]
MRILVTGSDGFIGKNLVESLKNIRDGKDLRHMIRKCAIPAHLEIMECTGDSPDELLDRYCKTADFVFCLAGTNRSQQAEAFIEGNTKSVAKVLELLKRHGRNTTVMYASSIQASLTGRYEGSFYGESKKQGEDLVRRYGEETGAATLIYRFVNVFGKWCRPDCHSVIATFCSHIAREEPIRVDDPKTQLRLIYIDDLIEELLQALDGRSSGSESGYAMVKPEYQASIEEIVAL